MHPPIHGGAAALRKPRFDPSISSPRRRNRAGPSTPAQRACERNHGVPSCRGSAGFTLVEIMVVVVILGILAATILPQFIGVTHDAKVSSAKAHVSEMESALERYSIHMDRYPSTDEGLRALVESPSGDDKKWRGPYINKLRADPWGSPYQYRQPGTHRPTSFDLWSMGADKADGGDGEAADVGNW